MSKLRIIYHDVPPGADQDASVSAPGAMTGSDVDQLPFGVTSEPAISGEWASWGLNGKYQPAQPPAFWSDQLSGKDCTFSDPPVITITFLRQYSSSGITLVFDTATDNYCSGTVEWLQGDTIKASASFEPASAQHFVPVVAEAYNKIVITLQMTKHPYRRAKLTRIMFGRLREFGTREARKAAIYADCDPISLEVPVSELVWTLESREDTGFLFQAKQPMEVIRAGQLLGWYYIDTAKRSGRGRYELNCHDALGVLDESPFPGAVYNGESARAAMEAIAGPDFSVDFQVSDTPIEGAILPCTRREAIQQVAFFLGACVSTDGGDSIRVFRPSVAPATISGRCTYKGAEVSTASIVTRVEVTYHNFERDDNGSVEINGVMYRDTPGIVAVDNPNTTSSDKPRVIEIKDATLVSASSAGSIAARVLDYYNRRNSAEAKIVWQGERLGDCVAVPNAWGGVSTGTITGLEIKLSNTVAAVCRTLET